MSRPRFPVDFGVRTNARKSPRTQPRRNASRRPARRSTLLRPIRRGWKTRRRRLRRSTFLRQSAAVLGTRRAVFFVNARAFDRFLTFLRPTRRGWRKKRAAAGFSSLPRRLAEFSRFFLFARRFCRTRAFYGSLGREFAATFSGIALFLGGTRRQRKRVAKPNVDKKRRRTPGREGDDGQAILLGKSSLNFLKFA